MWCLGFLGLSFQMLCKLWNVNVNHWCVFSSACCPRFPISHFCFISSGGLSPQMARSTSSPVPVILAPETGSPTAIKDFTKQTWMPSSSQILRLIFSKTTTVSCLITRTLTFGPWSYYWLSELSLHLPHGFLRAQFWNLFTCYSECCNMTECTWKTKL